MDVLNALICQSHVFIRCYSRYLQFQNLLTYIQALPERELSRLTADMSEDVMESIKMVVNALMERLGVDITGPDVIIQQSVGAMAQLCMWQMVVGYKLREFEAFEKGLSFTADGPSLQ